MLARLAFEPRVLDRRVAENQHRPRHLADLVGARLGGNLDRRVALGEAAHRLGHALQRAGDDAAEQPPDAEDDKQAAERAAAGDLDQQRAQGGKIGGGRDAAREHGDDFALLQPHAGAVAALADLLRRGERPAENDRHAVAIGAGDEARDRAAGAHRLLVDVVDRRLGGAVGIGLRHEGGDLRAPHAPQLARDRLCCGCRTSR